MSKLYQCEPERFFAFGCSFTQYNWPTWADFVAIDLGPSVQYYNFGKQGAGNQYIANTIAQADAKYNFTKNDLVMVCWTNVLREDRMYNDGNDEKNTPTWIAPGNLTTQTVYDKKWLDRFGTCKDWFYIRDFASIHLVTALLEKTNSHQLSMVDIHTTWDQYINSDSSEILCNIGSEAFPSSTQKIMPSIYKTLWNNNLSLKLKNDMKRINLYYADYHPTPDEHFQLLKKLFKNHKWAKTTELTAKTIKLEFIHLMKELYKKHNPKKVTIPYELFAIEGDTGITKNIKELQRRYFVQQPSTIFN